MKVGIVFYQYLLSPHLAYIFAFLSVFPYTALLLPLLKLLSLSCSFSSVSLKKV